MIHNGDALRILPTLGTFDLVITDPPYSSGAKKREWRSGGSVEASLYEASRHVRKDGTMIVFSASSGRSLERIASSVSPVLPLSRVLPWSKPHTRCRAAGPFGWQTVLILMFGKCGGATRAADHCLEPAMQYRRQGTTHHPAELPAAVGEWLALGLQDRAPAGASVLDPFCGTGSLLVPFALRGCDVTGIEIDERWAALARQRLFDSERQTA